MFSFIETHVAQANVEKAELTIEEMTEPPEAGKFSLYSCANNKNIHCMA